jgi:hypothetical protein
MFAGNDSRLTGNWSELAKSQNIAHETHYSPITTLVEQVEP